MRREITLYTYPATELYTAKDLGRLQRDLRQLQMQTGIHDLLSPRQLYLREDAATEDGFRYSAQGFAQLTRLAAPGLVRLLPDLAGTIRRPSDDYYDADLAIRTFNAVINLRFGLLERFLVVRHERSKLIIGFVTARNFYIDNDSWLRRILVMFDDMRTSFVFGGARLTGRVLALWFRAPKPTSQVPVEALRMPLYDGAYFCNGEALGSAIRGVRACYIPDGVLLGSLKEHGAAVRHAGQDFSINVERMLEKVATTTLPEALIAEQLGQLALRPLVAGVTTIKDLRNVCRNLAAQLTEFAVAGTAAQQAVQAAVYGDVDIAEYGSDEAFLADIGSRTWWSVIRGVLRVAKTYAFARRERIEQAMFDFITNEG